MEPYSIYLHIPFCRHRCAYCDFNTYAGLDNLIPAYIQALKGEIKYASSMLTSKLTIQSVYFGGGTPSLLPASEIAGLLIVLADCFHLDEKVEITLECNPGTLSLPYLLELKNAGVNRLSLGVQSANPFELTLLEREHDFQDVIQAVKWSRQAGFNNLNLDLIFGLPGQGLKEWQHTLRLANGVSPEHFSLYALTLEHGTPMAHWARRGLISEPDPDLAAEMYEWASDYLAEHGFKQYEISNWAACRNGRWLECRHNLQYWRNKPYLGFGAGAHGYAAGVRTANVLAPETYIKRMTKKDVNNEKKFPITPAMQTFTTPDRYTEIGETMMMGLRLVEEGISEVNFQERFGQSILEIFGPQIERLNCAGLVEWNDQNGRRLRLSQRGRLLGNQVFVEFI